MTLESILKLKNKMKTAGRIGLTALVLGFVSKVNAKTIYVDIDANGVNDGSSWTNAYKYLQNALTEANSADKPVEIQVAQGIYRPDRCASEPNGTGDRTATFQLISGVTLRGGYAGFGAPDPNVRDINEYETILSGDLRGEDVDINDPCDFPNQPTLAENSYHVVTVSSTDLNTLLEGVVVTGANLYCPDEADHRSAGLYVVSDANIAVSKCVFVGNAAPGILCCGSNPIVLDCVFENNIGGYRGGGMSIYHSNPCIIRCTFQDNWAWNGGGLYNYGGGRLWLENCTFTRNVASGLQLADVGFGGGLHSESSLAGSKIDNCTFIANIASDGGGAHFGYMSLAMLPLSRGEKTLLTACTFVRNLASWGGAISQGISTLDIDHCVFLENSALHTGGAISNLSSTTNLGHCIFSGNSASLGGACISAHGSTGIISGRYDLSLEFVLTLNNCTLKGNLAPIGRILACESYDSEDLNSTFISNCILDSGGNEIYNSDGSETTIAHTNLRGGVGSIYDPCDAVIWGEGNIDADPCFANPGYWADANDPNIPIEPNNPNAVWIDGDYHLKSQAGRWNPTNQIWIQDEVTSPCIDAGDPMSPIGHEPFPNDGIINMGAYGGTAEASKSYFGESVCETIIVGDINGDCKVDFSDFAIMALHWLEDNSFYPEVPEFYYYYNDQKMYLELYIAMIAVYFEDTVSREQKEALIESDTALEEIITEWPRYGLVLVGTKDGSSDVNIIQAVDRLEKLAEVRYSTPVFGHSTTQLILTDEFTGKFKPDVTQEEIDALNTLNGVEIEDKIEGIEHYILRVKDPINMNTLKIANLYSENAITIFSVPNWIAIGEPP